MFWRNSIFTESTELFVQQKLCTASALASKMHAQTAFQPDPQLTCMAAGRLCSTSRGKEVPVQPSLQEKSG